MAACQMLHRFCLEFFVADATFVAFERHQQELQQEQELLAETRNNLQKPGSAGSRQEQELLAETRNYRTTELDAGATKQLTKHTAGCACAWIVYMCAVLSKLLYRAMGLAGARGPNRAVPWLH
jgi:hypothetical protein